MVVGVCAKASSLLSHAHVEQPASLHRTVFERRSERETAGRVTRALWEEMEKTGGGLALEDGGQPQSAIVEAGRDLARANMAMAAGAGGLTSYLSLAPGTEGFWSNRHLLSHCQN